MSVDPLMTVWVTAKGSKYHREPGCEALREGHAKARELGLPNHPPRPVRLQDVENEACQHCWAGTDWDSTTQLDHQVARLSESKYEQLFYDTVLRHVLDPDEVEVTPQFRVTDPRGRSYRIDFVIDDGSRRLAIEIDGAEKTPGSSPWEFSTNGEVSQRQNALTSMGFIVLRFTNGQVANHTQRCRADVRDALGVDRSSSARANLGPAVTAKSIDVTHVASNSEMESVSTSPATPIPATSSQSAPAQGSAPRVSESASAGSLESPARGNGAGKGLFWSLGVLALVGVIASVVIMNGASGGSDTPATNQPSVTRQPAAPATASVNGNCAAPLVIKGNINDSNERIYHLPGWRYYASTDAEYCFASTAAAEAEGFRASKVK